MLVTVARLFVGILFIISGFIKANDPMGFGFKLEEYFQVFGTDWAIPFALPLAMGICILEIVLGVMLLIGSKPKFTSWLLLLMIVFFTFLTFYSAYFNKVTDCGCFGDAFKLTPWQSFWKDIVLFVFILIIFVKKRKIKPLLLAKSESNLLILTTMLSIGFTMHVWYYEPFIDFRAFKIGNSIPELMKTPEGAPQDSVAMIFIYKKDGKEFEFTADNIPEGDDYTFVDRKDKVIRQGYKPPIHDFTITDKTGSDYTQEFLTSKFALLSVAKDFKLTTQERVDKLNAYFAWSVKNDIPFAVLTSSLPRDAEAYHVMRGAKFPIFFTDGTTLKTMIRSNPGTIAISNGMVKAKWSSNDMPTVDDLEKIKTSN